MCKFFEGGFVGKIVICGLACLLFRFMQARYDGVQKKLAQKEEQLLTLQNVNKSQQESIARLRQEQEKQEQIICELQNQNKKLAQKYRAKQKQVYESNDNASADWKQGKIPDNILKVLRQ